MRLGVLVIQCIILLCALSAVGQKAVISNDSILIGNVLRYTISSDLKQIEAVELALPDAIAVASGPNISNSMTMINGEVTQTSTHSYLLKPTAVGSFFIPPSNIIFNDGTEEETMPLEINVFPNPENRKQPVDEPKEQWNWSLDSMMQQFDFFVPREYKQSESPKQQPSKRTLKRI